MSVELKIRKSIKELAGATDLRFETYAAIVTSVNGATCNVKRVLDDKIVERVRLNANVQEEKGLIIVPKEGSDVLITNIDGGASFVSQYSEIEKIELNVDSAIIINGGQNGGLVEIRKLEKNLERIKTYLIALEAALSTSITGLQGVLTIFSSANDISFVDMENKTIKH